MLIFHYNYENIFCFLFRFEEFDIFRFNETYIININKKEMRIKLIFYLK